MKESLDIEKILEVPFQDRKLNQFGRKAIAYYLKEKYNLPLELNKIENKVGISYMNDGDKSLRLRKSLECPELIIPDFFNKLIYYSPKPDVVVQKGKELVSYLSMLSLPVKIEPINESSLHCGLFSMYDQLIDLNLDQPSFELFIRQSVLMFKGSHYLEKLSPKPLPLKESYISSERSDEMLDFIFSNEEFRQFLNSEGLLKE